MGYVSPLRDPWGGLRSLLLPAITLGTVMAAIVMRMTRSSLLEVLQLDYVRTARAKGLAEPPVLLRHAPKNALVPVVTVVGLQAGALLGGATITETIFALPGVGRLLVDAIFQRDFPIVQGVVLPLVQFSDIGYKRVYRTGKGGTDEAAHPEGAERSDHDIVDRRVRNGDP